jgi:hypothetical protein
MARAIKNDAFKNSALKKRRGATIQFEEHVSNAVSQEDSCQ